MSQTIKAIYEDGAPSPLTLLELQDQTEALIRVEPAPERLDAHTHRCQVDRALVAAGLMAPAPWPSPRFSP